MGRSRSTDRYSRDNSKRARSESTTKRYSQVRSVEARRQPRDESPFSSRQRYNDGRRSGRDDSSKREIARSAPAFSRSNTGPQVQRRAGDWECPSCGLNVFASKVTLFKCGARKQSDGGRTGGQSTTRTVAGGPGGRNSRSGIGDERGEAGGPRLHTGCGGNGSSDQSILSPSRDAPDLMPEHLTGSAVGAVAAESPSEYLPSFPPAPPPMARRYVVPNASAAGGCPVKVNDLTGAASGADNAVVEERRKYLSSLPAPVQQELHVFIQQTIQHYGAFNDHAVNALCARYFIDADSARGIAVYFGVALQAPDGSAGPKPAPVVSERGAGPSRDGNFPGWYWMLAPDVQTELTAFVRQAVQHYGEFNGQALRDLCTKFELDPDSATKVAAAILAPPPPQTTVADLGPQITATSEYISGAGAGGSGPAFTAPAASHAWVVLQDPTGRSFRLNKTTGETDWGSVAAKAATGASAGAVGTAGALRQLPLPWRPQGAAAPQAEQAAPPQVNIQLAIIQNRKKLNEALAAANTALLPISTKSNVAITATFSPGMAATSDFHIRVQAMGVQIMADSAAGVSCHYHVLPYATLAGDVHQPCLIIVWATSPECKASLQFRPNKGLLTIKARRGVFMKYLQTFLAFLGPVVAVKGPQILPAAGQQASQKNSIMELLQDA